MSKTLTMCQSCGMPMEKPEDFGTEVDGTKNQIYCNFCYKDGSFTEPDISIEQMAERCGKILSQMFEMPIKEAEKFSLEQLRTLKRWSGRVVPTCESCGMPIMTDEDAGTEADGAKSSIYCIHCYQKGNFTEPDLKKEEMIKRASSIMAAKYNIPPEKSEEMVEKFVLALPRWQ